MYVERAQRALYYSVLLIVVLAPIPLGSFRPRYWFGLESLVFVLMAMYCVIGVIDRSTRRMLADRYRSHKHFCLFLLAWILIPIVQLIPLPEPVLELVSPTAYISTVAYTGEQLAQISVQPFATFAELLKRLMYVCALALVWCLLRNRKQITVSVILVVAAGLAQSLYSFSEHAADPAASLIGTYTNRNHFALYITFCLSLTIGYLVAITDLRKNISDVSGLSGQSFIIFGVMVVFVTILMFTQSKGGVLAFLAGVVFSFGLLRSRSGSHKRRLRSTIFVVLGGSLLVSLAIAGTSNLFARFEIQKILEDERWRQWSDSMGIFKDYWLTGSGAGTYQFVFPAYKSSEYRPLYYTHVHNDYIEALCNDGIIGLFVLIGIFVTWLLAIRGRYKKRRNVYIKGIVSGSTIAVSAAMFHGFVDFNFQVPANTLTLFAIMGLGLGTANLKLKPERM